MSTWTSFDASSWLDLIKESIEQEASADDDDTGVRVTVYYVSKELLDTKPDAYVPQLIAVGPYHRWRPQLLEMERYKLSSARRAQNYVDSHKFEDIVKGVSNIDRRVRAIYHRYLEVTDETLAWMMAVDGCFLLEFLEAYRTDETGKPLNRSAPSNLVNLAGQKSAHTIVLKDIMMLENQIPLLVMRRILALQHRPAIDGPADGLLGNMLKGLMMELSPFKMVKNFPPIDVSRHSHLLEVLYCVLVPRAATQEPPAAENGGSANHEVSVTIEAAENGGGGDEGPRFPSGDPENVKTLCVSLWDIAYNVASKPVKVVMKLPWGVLSTIPGFGFLKKPVKFLTPSDEEEDDDEEDHPERLRRRRSDPPLVEEILVPSVKDLISAGVRVQPTNGDLTTIAFDSKTATFSLPTVTLDVSTEVLLRNLVAYEASVSSGPLVITRYTELMNGIIDTDEDVKLLRQNGVILSHLKSDGEVADLWNGMSKSVRLSKVEYMDKVIEDINAYYNSRWKVKLKKLMRRYVFGSWQFLTFIAAILLLLLNALQAFCSVYGCSAKWFDVQGNEG